MKTYPPRFLGSVLACVLVFAQSASVQAAPLTIFAAEATPAAHAVTAPSSKPLGAKLDSQAPVSALAVPLNGSHVLDQPHAH
jgi:hypothetical protein